MQKQNSEQCMATFHETKYTRYLISSHRNLTNKIGNATQRNLTCLPFLKDTPAFLPFPTFSFLPFLKHGCFSTISFVMCSFDQLFEIISFLLTINTTQLKMQNLNKQPLN